MLMWFLFFVNDLFLLVSNRLYLKEKPYELLHLRHKYMTTINHITPTVNCFCPFFPFTLTVNSLTPTFTSTLSFSYALSSSASPYKPPRPNTANIPADGHPSPCPYPSPPHHLTPSLPHTCISQNTPCINHIPSRSPCRHSRRQGKASRHISHIYRLFIQSGGMSRTQPIRLPIPSCLPYHT